MGEKVISSKNAFSGLRKFLMLMVDIFLINLSISLAFTIKFDWFLTHAHVNSCIYFMAWVSIIRISLFIFFGMYEWSFRYASISEVINVLKATTIGSLLLITVAFFAERTELSRSVLLIDYFICLFLIGGSRFLPRVLIKIKQLKHANLKKVLIIGAGAAGEMIVREIINARKRTYQPIGFIDDDPNKWHSRIHGVRILGNMDDIKDVVKEHGVEEVIIAMPSASGKIIRDIISRCENTEVKIKTVPELHKILTGEITIREIRDVQPQDLLGREAVQINAQDVGSFIRDKVLLVTGAGGTIGAELCKQSVKFAPKAILLYDHNENDVYFLKLEFEEKYPEIKFEIIIGDIKDMGLLAHVFSRYRPNIVFHSAAHKHVPIMEENIAAVVKNNIIGTKNVMYAAEHYGAESFVMISTDKAVNPTSAMGTSKRIAEMIIQSKSKTSRTKFMAVRFGNVIGSSGSVVQLFKKQIEQKSHITVTHPDVKRFFMTASEAAQLVIQAGAMGKGGEIFILDMGEQIKIIDLAKNLITLSGLEPGKDIDIKFTGLRKGEKIEEEILLDVEHDKATKHDKIYIAQPDNFNLAQLEKDIKVLEEAANLMDEKIMIEKMGELVPTYRHSGKRNEKV